MGWQELIVLIIVAACGYYAWRSFRESWKGQGGCAKCPAGKPKPVTIEKIGILRNKLN
ncbi:MAG TPA: FeoB-associated Cys-rich membrane protein [bacterium]|nr:FeoB-associated Cys-rich membrane protein [Candidatus Omnitrophota bacterium]HOL93530.1 FeoB-associated Cys-rich membrane protein [bacterium]HPP00512.1 FeoB-associated Cys-rich membrane protein [bacterium]